MNNNEIIEYCRKKLKTPGISPCYIAETRRICGIPKRTRKSELERKKSLKDNPIGEEKFEIIKAALVKNKELKKSIADSISYPYPTSVNIRNKGTRNKLKAIHNELAIGEPLKILSINLIVSIDTRGNVVASSIDSIKMVS